MLRGPEQLLAPKQVPPSLPGGEGLERRQADHLEDNQPGAATSPAQQHTAQPGSLQPKNLTDAHKQLLTDTLLRGRCHLKPGQGSTGC